ncbi:Rrf2 family transcriptional regulator [Oceanispirochaeta crateris]|uniref:Rrf2 family transcriptional regulator n=1 Tax=Oceanispirochaeta crateris TaxID=2518645 RepID=A0A5C1QL94_9SPIO|nr:Rrf2 family transcriptional regulator [Oceanispirochaeta crateris]QEN08247.1 Rrf2 family transcriptional regulator [Oceanispirochaeta crateris]
MQIGTKFSVSIHILLSVEVFKNDYKVTSDFIASSVNTNPVVIRKLMSLLRNAGLIEITQGTGGIELTRAPDQISLKDIYKAVEPQTELFKIHKDTAPGCPVGGNIEHLLTPYFAKLQSSFNENLNTVTLADMMTSLANLHKR